MDIEKEYNKWVATDKDGLGNNELYQFTKSELIDFGKHLVNKTNDIHNVSELFSAKEMKDFAADLSGKKVGGLDLILFKNNR